jgi:serine protease Do
MKRFIEISCAGLMAVALNVGAVAQVPQERPSIDPLQALNASLGQLTAKVYPAIVHIRVASYGSSAQYGSEEKSQSLAKQNWFGSGVIVDSEGYIVTALHVVEGERRIRVDLNSTIISTTSDSRVQGQKRRSSIEATLVGSFKDADLAVLKIDARDLPTLSFADSDSLKQGQLVAALGSPEGLRNSLSLGVVSSIAQQIGPDDSVAYIETDAALAPGSSGGPLIDVQGGIVGINVSSVTDEGRQVGLGLAVPSTIVRFAYEQIRQYGCVPRASLGMDIQGITPTLASALRLSLDSGVIVAGVLPGSPAEKASVRAGDVILSFAGIHVKTVPQLTWALLHKRAGERVVLEIVRESQKIELSLTLMGEPPDSGGLAASEIEENALNKLGIVGSAFKRGGIGPHARGSSSGVLVTAKLSGADMQPELVVGDVIRSVNGVSVTAVAPLRVMLDNFKPGEAIALQVERKGKLMYVAFEMD